MRLIFNDTSMSIVEYDKLESIASDNAVYRIEIKKLLNIEVKYFEVDSVFKSKSELQFVYDFSRTFYKADQILVQRIYNE